MKCPFCFHIITPGTECCLEETDRVGTWRLLRHRCTNAICDRIFIELMQFRAVVDRDGQRELIDTDKSLLIFPRISAREPAKPEVPKEFADDYNEACLVLSDSPKASAALGRRCLQAVLEEAAKVKPGQLVEEIQEVLDRGTLPSHLSESLDAIRYVGNFATHSIKSKSSGEVVPVEPGEAEWTLDTLEGLFDFYFVQPEITKRKKDALNKKLAEAGKPPLK